MFAGVYYDLWCGFPLWLWSLVCRWPLLRSPVEPEDYRLPCISIVTEQGMKVLRFFFGYSNAVQDALSTQLSSQMAVVWIGRMIEVYLGPKPFHHARNNWGSIVVNSSFTKHTKISVLVECAWYLVKNGITISAFRQKVGIEVTMRQVIQEWYRDNETMQRSLLVLVGSMKASGTPTNWQIEWIVRGNMLVVTKAKYKWPVSTSFRKT